MTAFASRFQQRPSVPASMGRQTFERLLADAARRRVHDPQECHVVLRIVQQVQVRQHILDFTTLVEFQTANDLIRHTRPAQGMLQLSRQRIDSVEDGKVLRTPLLAVDRFGNAPGDVIGFVPRRFVHDQFHGRPIGLFCVKPFWFSFDVVRDQLIRGSQNIRSAAEILLEPYDFDAIEVLFEVQNIVQIRAAPTVDRLIRVARYGQIGMVDRQGTYDGVLCQVRVLVLVHQDVTVSLVQRRPQFGTTFQ